jgi:uncharacterized membrane protein
VKNRYLLACILILLASLAVSLLVYQRLPERVPVHWNAAGEIDRYGSPASIFVHSGMMLFFICVWAILPRLSPQHFSVEEFHKTYWYTGLVLVCLLAYIQCVILWGTWTRTSSMTRAMTGGIAVFSILLGNVIGKVRRNFWLGIRTPWTLANERVWYATHRLAGKSIVVAGLLALAAVLAGLPALVAIGIIVAGMLLPAAWSLVYYKRLERSGKLQA